MSKSAFGSVKNKIQRQKRLRLLKGWRERADERTPKMLWLSSACLLGSEQSAGCPANATVYQKIPSFAYWPINQNTGCFSSQSIRPFARLHFNHCTFHQAPRNEFKQSMGCAMLIGHPRKVCVQRPIGAHWRVRSWRAWFCTQKHVDAHLSTAKFYFARGGGVRIASATQSTFRKDCIDNIETTTLVSPCGPVVST